MQTGCLAIFQSVWYSINHDQIASVFCIYYTPCMCSGATSFNISNWELGPAICIITMDIFFKIRTISQQKIPQIHPHFFRKHETQKKVTNRIQRLHFCRNYSAKCLLTFAVPPICDLWSIGYVDLKRLFFFEWERMYQ